MDGGDGNNFVLNINNEPNTTDTTPIPAPGTSAIWKYKAIYRLHGEQVGQWCDVISVSVGGLGILVNVLSRSLYSVK